MANIKPISMASTIDMRIPALNVRAPASVDERIISQYRKRDLATGGVEPDAALDALSSALHSARQSAEHLVAAHAAVSADPTITPEARALKIRRAVTSQGEKIAAKLDTAHSRALAEIERVSKSMAIPAPASASDIALASEIRQRFASISDDTSNGAPADGKRTKAILDAIKAGNERLAGAVLTADPFLVGITAETHAALALEWNKRRHPDGVDRVRRLNSAVKAFEQSASIFTTFIKELASDPVAEATERKMDAASEALKAAEAAQ